MATSGLPLWGISLVAGVALLTGEMLAGQTRDDTIRTLPESVLTRSPASAPIAQPTPAPIAQPTPVKQTTCPTLRGPRPTGYALKAPEGEPDCLPPFYRGQDPARVFASIKESPKSEFETAEQFRQRTAGRLAGLRYAFRLDQQAATVSYNAEHQAFDIAFELGSLALPATLAWPLNSREIPLGQSVAQNAFGATIGVRKVRRLEWALAASVVSPAFAKNCGAGSTCQILKESENPVSLRLPLPPDKARQAKPALSFLLVVEPAGCADGWVTQTQSDLRNPTLTRPIQMTIESHYLSVGALSVWAYDLPSGRVWERWAMVPLTWAD